MVYSSQQASMLFGVSRATINNWAKEFAQYLSDGASPGGNKNRHFAIEDMAVLALVANLKDANQTYPAIHRALQAGERGSIPDTPPSDLQPLSPAEKDRRVTLVVEQLQQTLASLKLELAEAQQVAAQVHETREVNARLQAQVDFLKEQQERLERQMAAYQDEVRTLSLQAGREYAKGFLEGFHSAREDGKDEK